MQLFDTGKRGFRELCPRVFKNTHSGYVWEPTRGKLRKTNLSCQVGRGICETAVHEAILQKVPVATAKIARMLFKNDGGVMFDTYAYTMFSAEIGNISAIRYIARIRQQFFRRTLSSSALELAANR